MYAASLAQIYLEDRVQNEGLFDTTHWKYFIIVHACMCIEKLGEKMEEEIRGMYGAGDGGVGPFSVKGYLKHHAKEKEWGDSLMLDLMSSGTSLRITVLNSRTCSEHRIRHNKSLVGVDIVLVFNGNTVNGHYSGVMWQDGARVDCSGSFQTGSGFDPEVDARERLLRGGKKGTGVETITSSRLQVLLRKEKILDEMFSCYDLDEEDMERALAGTARVRTGKSMYLPPNPDAHMPQSIQKVKEGDVECTHCKKRFADTLELQKHIAKVHEGKIKFRCSKCAKGFMSKQGLREHAKLHQSKEHRYVCTEKDDEGEECGITFGRNTNLKKHQLKFHPKEGKELPELECAFQCGYKTIDLGNKVQHEARCKKNTGKKPIPCDICTTKKYNFYLVKDLLRHKREEHGL